MVSLIDGVGSLLVGRRPPDSKAYLFPFPRRPPKTCAYDDLAEKRYTFNDCEKTNGSKTTTNSDNAILLPVPPMKNKTRHERYTKPGNQKMPSFSYCTGAQSSS